MVTIKEVPFRVTYQEGEWTGECSELNVFLVGDTKKALIKSIETLLTEMEEELAKKSVPAEEEPVEEPLVKRVSPIGPRWYRVLENTAGERD
jgi:hypothetical protein